MQGARYANQYRQTGVSSAVLDADPHRLISLMLAGARERARLAEACLHRGDLARKAQAISDASAIIGGLNGALDLEAGGEIAGGLQAQSAEQVVGGGGALRLRATAPGGSQRGQ